MKKPLLAAALSSLLAATSCSAPNPWVGRWKPDPARSNYIEANDTLIISAPSRSTLRWEYPAIKFEMQGKPDGSQMSMTYPNMPPALTEYMTMLTPTKLIYSVKHAGKLVEQGTDELSSDRKTLTAISWDIGRESNKRTEIFNRQCNQTTKTPTARVPHSSRHHRDEWECKLPKAPHPKEPMQTPRRFTQPANRLPCT